ncbi:MAG: histidine kinase [Sediminibacterium sp.]|nr:histidine kinase [Sediminibacterium sp.]MBP6144562.1 histidine kinase [Sediminibacterium sp.]
MKKHQSIYWICQIGGWMTYGFTIIFFSYMLEKKLNPVFYPRLLVNILIGIILTHLFRKAMLAFALHPPMPKFKWWKLLLLLLTFASLYSFFTSYTVEMLKLYDATKKVSIEKRFLISLVIDTPIIFVWLSIYILWHYIEFTNSEAIQKIKLESLIKELQLKTIKSQMNPHFIFNALNSIRALVDEDPQRARQAITELSNILRSSIQADQAEVTSLEKELNIVKDYLALEYIRFADRLVVEYEIEAATLSNQMPPMMLQTLVENAIKHGLSKQPGNCLIKIVSKFEEGKHLLMVQNTGVLDKEMGQDGFGLQSTKNRLNILYRGNAVFDIYQSQPTQVTAKLIIPIA